jgi:hypothetical protein
LSSIGEHTSLCEENVSQYLGWLLNRLLNTAWAIFFGSMWANFESRFDSILRSLADHSELVDKEAAAANISDAVTRHKQDSQKWEQQEREWETLKIRTTLSWLGTSDGLPADVLERHIRDCLPGSCDWFVNHDKTQLWLGDGAENALLWLYGKPGAGECFGRCKLIS